MYILYSIGVLIIMLIAIDIVYCVYKKYIEYINKKSGKNREINMPMLYPISFLAGCIIRILLFAKDVSFLILLKETFLVGMLILLIVYNIKIVKNRVSEAGKGFSKLKDIEKSDGEKLFSKKNKKDKKEDD